MEPLLDAGDLAGFPGAPFSSSQVAAAAGQVRDACGWHIAPQITETLVVDSDGATVLPLPTLKVVTIVQVRDLTRDEPTVLTGWRSSPAGLLIRSQGWPAGVAAVEVSLTHGYEECPDALLPVIAERCQLFRRDGSIRQESLGSRSASYGYDEHSTSGQTVARYTIPTSP